MKAAIDPLVMHLMEKQLYSAKHNIPQKIETPQEALAEKRLAILMIDEGVFDGAQSNPALLELMKDMAKRILTASTVVFITDDVYSFIGDLTRKIYTSYKLLPDGDMPEKKKLPFNFMFHTTTGGISRAGSKSSKTVVDYEVFFKDTTNDGVSGIAFTNNPPTITALVSGIDRLSQAYNDALCLALSEKIVVTKKVKAYKSDRNIQKKLKLDYNEEIHVIQFREIARQEKTNKRQSEPTTEYHRQWLVRGHIRNQYYPSTGMHETIWIDPHIKGPEDMPFIESIRHGIR